MCGYHLPDAVLALALKIRVTHGFLFQASGVVFLPYQNPLLITQIQHQLIIGIMNRPYGICPQILYKHQITLNGRKRNGTAKLGMVLMPTKAFHQKLFSIKQNVLPADFDFSKAHPVNQIIDCLSVLICNGSRYVI